MVPLHSPKEYLFNLYVTSSGDAKRLWKKHIKEEWNNECAYCGSTDNLTIDHILPRSKGGSNHIENVVCCCNSCNQNKSHTSWEKWYFSQDFFNQNNYNKILNWMETKSFT